MLVTLENGKSANKRNPSNAMSPEHANAPTTPLDTTHSTDELYPCTMKQKNTLKIRGVGMYGTLSDDQWQQALSPFRTGYHEDMGNHDPTPGTNGHSGTADKFLNGKGTQQHQNEGAYSGETQPGYEIPFEQRKGQFGSQKFLRQYEMDLVRRTRITSYSGRNKTYGVDPEFNIIVWGIVILAVLYIGLELFF